MAAATWLNAGPAFAQFDQLDPDLPCKVSNFTAADEQAIQRFAADALTRLASDDTAEIERARRDLETPLSRNCVSVAFRQLFRRETIDQLTNLAADANEIVAINALFVAGDAAEPATMQLLQQHTGDARVSVRQAAISGLKSTLRSVNRTAPAINDGQVLGVAQHLGEALGNETHPHIIDSIVRTLLQADSITRPDFNSGRARALSETANRLVGKLREAEESDRPLLNLSALRVCEHVSRKLAAPDGVPPQACRDGAAFAGELLAAIAHRANAGQLGDSRQTEVDLANLCERMIALGHVKLGGAGSPPQPGLAALLESGDDRAFMREVQETVLRLDGTPFNLTSAQMQRIRDALENG